MTTFLWNPIDKKRIHLVNWDVMSTALKGRVWLDLYCKKQTIQSDSLVAKSLVVHMKFKFGLILGMSQSLSFIFLWQLMLIWSVMRKLSRNFALFPRFFPAWSVISHSAWQLMLIWLSIKDLSSDLLFSHKNSDLIYIGAFKLEAYSLKTSHCCSPILSGNSISDVCCCCNFVSESLYHCIFDGTYFRIVADAP